MRKRKPSQKLTRFEVGRSDELKAMLAELCPIAEDATIASLIGWRDARGNPRRMRATWDNGWSVDLFITLPRDGKPRVSSYRMNWRGAIRGKAA